MKINHIIIIAVITGLILLIPLTAMQFTAEINWNIYDFVISAVLLFCTGLAIDFVLSKFKNPSQRILGVFIILGIFIAIWTELAVNAVSKLLKYIIG